MTSQRRWSLLAGTVMTFVFIAALVLKVRPQMDLIGAGSKAPDFQAVNLRTHRPASLADYAGKVIVLNIWATWCDPCRLEMPSMQRLSERLAGPDFRVVAVSVDKDNPEGVMKFVNDLGLRFDILHDPSGKIQQTLQTTGVPESFVIDRSGTIIKKVIGAERWDSPVNETLIKHLLDAQ